MSEINVLRVTDEAVDALIEFVNSDRGNISDVSAKRASDGCGVIVSVEYDDGSLKIVTFPLTPEV